MRYEKTCVVLHAILQLISSLSKELMHYCLQAVVIASEVFGNQHPKYADTLIDYGFYLLSVDAISQGVQVYQVTDSF